MSEKDSYWDLEIKPQRSLFELHLRDVWQYRDLLMLLVRRDIVSFYKQTILGPLWFFLQPVFTTAVFTFIFGNLAGISTDGLPQPLFYLAGTIIWNYFSECLVKTSTVFKDNAPLMGKVYFPRLIMPLSIVVSNLARLSIQFLLFLAAMAFYGLKGSLFHPTFFALLLPLQIFFIALQGLGLGMIISALTTKYRDLAFVVSFGVQLLMYATTVIYPLSAAPEKYRPFIALNPMTPVIESFRLGFLGSGTADWASLGYCALVSVLIMLAGLIIFNKVEKDFVDTI
ncbi:MAG: ABC transporter permease [Mucilaginibacter polytrichastri]|nr:ABC transporter permease [Mucilaginibacter polytrichastri]